MNIEICKKCTGCQKLEVNLFRYYDSSTVHVNISVPSDESYNLYHSVCEFDILDSSVVCEFEDILPEQIVNPRCKYLAEHFFDT